MKRTLPLALILAVIGCRSNGTGLLYPKPGRADDPMYSIEEQQRRGRERIATVEDTNLTPKVFVDRPGTDGR